MTRTAATHLSPAVREGVLPIASIVSVGVSGSVILAMLPLLVGLLVDRSHLPLAAAGTMAALRMAGGTLGCIVTVPLTRRADWRLVAGTSLVIILLGNGMCLLAGNTVTLGIWQFVTGLGEGATAIAGAAIASMRNPDRGYGILGAVSLSLGTATYTIAPPLAASFGIAGLVLPMMLIPFVGLMLLRGFPTTGTSEIDSSLPAPGLFDARAVTGVMAMALFYLGLAAIWSCAERIGVERSGSQVLVGQAIGSLNLLFGLAGSGIAMICGNRYGHRWPVLFALGASVPGYLFLCQGGWGLYLAGVSLTVLAWMSAFPFMMGALAAIDPSGRLAVTGLVVQTGCFAAGPWLGTHLLPIGALILFIAAASCSIIAGGFILAATSNIHLEQEKMHKDIEI